MAPTNRPDGHLSPGYLPQLSATQPRSGSSTSNTSPIEPPAGTAMKSPFGGPNGLNSGGTTNSARLGAGSPSHELGGRLYSKRLVS
jgi:protein JSN1